MDLSIRLPYVPAVHDYRRRTRLLTTLASFSVMCFRSVLRRRRLSKQVAFHCGCSVSVTDNCAMDCPVVYLQIRVVTFCVVFFIPYRLASVSVWTPSTR